MTVPEYMADATERAAAFLTHFVESTPPEKRDWTPPLAGAVELRPMLDMVGECILANRMFASVLQGAPPPSASPIEAPRPFESWEDGKLQLAESAKALADVIRGLTDADLEKTIVTRRGPLPCAQVIEMATRNMHYHTGQVNLFQLLYGDAVFHFPAPKPQS
jgi:hypothetical protein